MKVYVKLFATLRPYHPGPNRSEPLAVELAQGARAADLVPALNLPEKLVRHAFINNQQKTLDTVLSEGDKINLFPPVVGGFH
jgi:molybdopterin converting factor small subunit